MNTLPGDPTYPPGTLASDISDRKRRREEDDDDADELYWHWLDAITEDLYD